MQLSIQIDKKEIEADLKRLGPDAKKCIARSLNRAMSGFKTDAGREAAALYTIKVGEVKKTIKITKARASKLSAAAVSTGAAIPAFKFGGKPAAPPLQAGIPVRSRRPKEASYKLFKSRSKVRGGFVQKMKSGHVGLFVRMPDATARMRTKDGKRTSTALPIKEWLGASVPAMLGTESVFKRLQDKLLARYDKEIKHNIDFMWKQKTALADDVA